MPMMIQIQGAEVVSQEMAVPQEGGKVGKVVALVLHDPLSGISVQTIFAEDEAEIDDAGVFKILPQPSSDLVVAGANEMPGPPIPNGSGGRRTRPGR